MFFKLHVEILLFAGSHFGLGAFHLHLDDGLDVAVEFGLKGLYFGCLF